MAKWRLLPENSFVEKLVVIFLAEVGDHFFAHHPAQSIFEFHGLDEKVVLGVKRRRTHGRFEIEAEPFLDAVHAGALREIEEENEIENQRRGENGIAAEKIDLDLHRIAEPAENVDVVPAFFVVAAGRVVVDADLMKYLPVKFGVKFRLENVFKDAEF